MINKSGKLSKDSIELFTVLARARAVTTGALVGGLFSARYNSTTGFDPDTEYTNLDREERVASNGGIPFICVIV